MWLGEWHTHPHGDPRPSPVDLETYARLLEHPRLGFEVIVSAIVIPGPTGGWAEAAITTWVIGGPVRGASPPTR